MEKTNKQIKNLKINVTNIKSFLITSNKKIKKLDLDKDSLFNKIESENKNIKKEKSLESPIKKIGQVVGGISQKVLKGPLSIFGAIKEFFAIILEGIIIANLPNIINAIKKFFDDNKLLIDGIKFTLDIIGKAIGGIISLVSKFTDSDQDKINKDGKKLKDEFGNLDKELDGDIKDVDKTLSDLQKQDKDEKRSQETERYSRRITERQESRQTSSPGSINPQSTNQSPQSRRTPEKPPEVQKFAKGGVVQPRKSVDTGSRPEVRKTMTSGSSSLGASRGSVRSKKATQTVNYFSFFNNNNVVSQEIVEKDSKNVDTFRNILVSLKSIQEIRKQLGDDEGGGPGGGGGSGGGGGGGDMLPGDASPEMKAAMEAIAGAEGGWNSVNPGKVVPGLTNMTIAQAREVGMRQRLIEGSGALGKFQQIPVYDGVNVLKQRAEAAGLNYQTDKFNEENQTKITRAYLAGIYPGGEAQLIRDARKDPMILANKLKGVYPSLPGGSQPNVHTSGYLDRFRNAYAKYKAPSSAPTTGSIATVLPIGNPRFSSPFGMRTLNGKTRMHQGIDIGVDANSPVTALQDGQVIDIYRNFGNWGDAVVVKHSDGTMWIYGHVISSVRIGASVRKGQTIAKVKYWPPNTAGSGNYDNTHLHLERVVGGRKINPTADLNRVSTPPVQLSSILKETNLEDPLSGTMGSTTIAVLPMVNNRMIPVTIPLPYSVG